MVERLHVSADSNVALAVVVLPGTWFFRAGVNPLPCGIQPFYSHMCVVHRFSSSGVGRLVHFPSVAVIAKLAKFFFHTTNGASGFPLFLCHSETFGKPIQSENIPGVIELSVEHPAKPAEGCPAYINAVIPQPLPQSYRPAVLRPGEHDVYYAHSLLHFPIG